MDSGEGRFVPVSDALKEALQSMPDNELSTLANVFKVGETLIMKQSRFRVKSIKPKELRLKLLPREKGGG